MSEYLGDFLAGRIVRAAFNTVNTSAVPTSLSAGAVIVSKDGGDITPAVGSVTLTADAGSVTGRNTLVVDMSLDAANFTAGSEYKARLSGTSNVGGTSVVGRVVAEWSVCNRSTFPSVRTFQAQAGGASTITLDAGASAVDNFYRGQPVVPISGTGAGQSARRVISYVGATRVATLDRPWITNPDATTIAVIGPDPGPALTAANSTIGVDVETMLNAVPVPITAPVLATGTVTAGISTTQFTATVTPSAATFATGVNRVLWQGGANNGSDWLIATDTGGSPRTITLAKAMPNIPVSSPADTFIII